MAAVLLKCFWTASRYFEVLDPPQLAKVWYTNGTSTLSFQSHAHFLGTAEPSHLVTRPWWPQSYRRHSKAVASTCSWDLPPTPAHRPRFLNTSKHEGSGKLTKPTFENNKQKIMSTSVGYEIIVTCVVEFCCHVLPYCHVFQCDFQGTVRPTNDHLMSCTIHHSCHLHEGDPQSGPWSFLSKFIYMYIWTYLV